MSKKPSVETQLRTLKRLHSLTQRHLDIACQKLKAEQERATKAEQTSAEWKRRFDMLLQHGFRARDPEAPVSALETRVREMVGSTKEIGPYVEAIKMVRNETGCSLKAGKEYVDQFRAVA